MKNKYLVLLLIGLFMPLLVFAHEAYTKVDVDVFYKEKDAYYDTLMIALDELSNEEETKGVFEVTTHPYSETLSQKAYKYASIENSNDLLIIIGDGIITSFSNKKFISENSDTVSSLYKYYKGYLKEKILYEYKSSSSMGLVAELESGYWDSYLYDTTPVQIADEGSDTDFDEYEELKNIIKDFKNSIKDDKMAKNIMYPIIFLILFSIVTKTLKNSIHKNK